MGVGVGSGPVSYTHLDVYKRQALDLDVRVNHEVIGVDAAAKRVSVRGARGVFELPYDALILAPGAVAARPPIDGLDSPRVRTLRTVADAVALLSLIHI